MQNQKFSFFGTANRYGTETQGNAQHRTQDAVNVLRC